MKKIFEYIGLTVLFLFSYYYTSEIAEYMSNKDEIMVFLEEKNSTLRSECTEGYINDDGVVLGISGLIIDMEKSYQNMKGFGYDESLIEYNENKCAVNKENSLGRYIIKGNPNKNAVSIIILLGDFEYAESFIETAKNKNIEISLLVNDNIYKSKKDILYNYYSNNVDVLYNGNDIKEFSKTFKNTYCVHTDSGKILEECKKAKINSIKVEKVYDKNAVINIKETLDKGDFIILNENKNNLNEFNILINYITSKGIKILNVTNHLK